MTALHWDLEKGISLEAGARRSASSTPISSSSGSEAGRARPAVGTAEEDGHIGVPRVPRLGSYNDTAIFVRREGPLVCTEEYPPALAPWQAPANIAVRLHDADGTLSSRQIIAVSMHTCYRSPEHHLTETRWCTTLPKPGWLAMIFGDWHSYRVGTDVRWGGYTDHAFVAHRAYAYDGHG